MKDSRSERITLRPELPKVPENSRLVLAIIRLRPIWILSGNLLGSLLYKPIDVAENVSDQLHEFWVHSRPTFTAQFTAR